MAECIFFVLVTAYICEYQNLQVLVRRPRVAVAVGLVEHVLVVESGRRRLTSVARCSNPLSDGRERSIRLQKTSSLSSGTERAGTNGVLTPGWLLSRSRGEILWAVEEASPRSRGCFRSVYREVCLWRHVGSVLAVRHRANVRDAISHKHSWSTHGLSGLAGTRWA